MLFGGIVGRGAAKIKTQKSGYFLVKSAKRKGNIRCNLHSTVSQLDIQIADTLALTEAANGREACPGAHGLAP